MKRGMLSKSVAVLSVVAAGLVSPEAQARHTSISISTDGDRPIDRCDQVHVRFGDREDPMPMARNENRLAMSRHSRIPLHIKLSRSDGMRIQGWDGDDYAVKVCLAAGAESVKAAQKRLSEISVSLEDGGFHVQGPEEENWLVYLLVQAPQDAVLELETESGDISLQGVSGQVRARSENGPISLNKCSHQIQASTQNGPISISGGSGDFRLKAENGPISVDLLGAAWQGPGLEARTENGPLALQLPGNYRMGIRVEASGHSPMSCKASECREARKSWDEDLRWIEFGSEPATVKLYTVNGPVSIRSRSVEF